MFVVAKSNFEVGQPGSLLFPGAHILLFRRKDRECLMWIHLRFVGICVCMCVWVFVHLHMSVCLSERCGLSYALLIVACWLCSALIAMQVCALNGLLCKSGAFFLYHFRSYRNCLDMKNYINMTGSKNGKQKPISHLSPVLFEIKKTLEGNSNTTVEAILKAYLSQIIQTKAEGYHYRQSTASYLEEDFF